MNTSYTQEIGFTLGIGASVYVIWYAIAKFTPFGKRYLKRYEGVMSFVIMLILCFDSLLHGANKFLKHNVTEGISDISMGVVTSFVIFSRFSRGSFRKIK